MAEHHIIFIQANSFNPSCLTLRTFSKALETGSVTADCMRYYIESSYCTVVSILCSGTRAYIPKCHKEFFKYWWDEELSLLKEASVESDRVWNARECS